MFEWKDFISHSGKSFQWKIECDDLTDGDIECIANIINGQLSFKKVYGIPRGGLRLAAALQKYCDPDAREILIVDDVLTTGKSMEKMRETMRKAGESSPIYGVVIFSRGGSLPWVFPIFNTSW
jgi:adenine/guanine phosphoribosyltransferase-like PRPP-binding protein